jgi:F1F0 ATPase subunit 2
VSAIGTSLLAALAGGMLLGAIYLAVLWLSVRGLAHVRLPGLLMVASYMLRMLLLIGGLYLLGDGQWQSYVTALAGFILVRTLVLRRLGRSDERTTIALPGGD